MKNKKTVFYGFIVLMIVFAVHFLISVILKQAVKYAVFSEAVGITAALIAVSFVMLIMYFGGRKLILAKEIIPLKCYYVLSAVIPPFVWLIITIVKCAVFITSTDFNAIISEPDIWYIINSLWDLMKTLNSFISLFSSSMIFIIAGLFEIINVLVIKLMKRVRKN